MKELLNKIEYKKWTELDSFSALIRNLFPDGDVFEPESGLREEDDISEEELRDCVKKNFVKNEKFLSLRFYSL